jgi:phosphoesterase RecJ-like protein
MSPLIHQQIKEAIKQAEHILLLSDERIDGDTIGSTLGMYHVLKEMGKSVEVFSPSPMVESLAFLPGVDVIQRDPIVFDNPNIDLVMIFDCADGKYIQEYLPRLEANTPLIVVDHHDTNPKYGTLNLVEPNSASSADVTWRMIETAGLPMTKNAAQCILTGICTDTNAFSTSNTTAACLNAAHELAKHGAKLQEIVRHTMMNKSLSTLKLWGIAFERLYEDEKFGAITTAITRKDIEECKVTDADSKAMINFLNAMIDGADVVLVLKEADDGSVKGSFRSHNTDVAAKAGEFGGGGHTRAAGFKVKNAYLQERDGKWKIVKK